MSIGPPFSGTSDEWPGYGVGPCDSEWHRQRHHRDDRCPDCGNRWWAEDGSKCPDEYKLIAEIDVLRERRAEP